MGPTSPTRIDDELYASAKVVGQLMSRSAAQQMAHWARIGRELEAAGSVSHGDVAEVLAARQEYDTLTTHEQTVVRAEWAERMCPPRGARPRSGVLRSGTSLRGTGGEGPGRAS